MIKKVDICTVYHNKQEIQTSTQELFKLSPKLNELTGDNNNLDKINQVLFILFGLKKDNNKKCIQYFKSREQITLYVPIYSNNISVNESGYQYSYY